jgi:serine/threonine protein kinase
MPDPLSVNVVETSFAGDYTNLSQLGSQGAQGVVYRATAADRTDVALKVYSADQVEERSVREVNALSRLKGENIVRLHGAGQVTIDGEQYRFIATTFIEGKPLSEILAVAPVSDVECAMYGADIARAIAELWSLNIVHRDVKPPNIMIRTDKRAILIDLGIARHLDLITLTGPGMTWGTPGYFAPELLRGLRPTCKADVFSLGIVIEEMVLGRHPTRRRQHLLSGGGPNIARLRPDTSSALANIVDQMVDVRPFLRPLPGEVAARLDEVVRQIMGGS